MNENVSIGIWYEGKFKEAKGCISYVGGFGTIMEVDQMICPTQASTQPT